MEALHNGNNYRRTISELNNGQVILVNSNDGYWITLQEWSQCSLHCGGGISTKQRMCVPPKEGGLPCEGPAILTKPCNIQPCPRVKGISPNDQKYDAVKKPIVKIMPFSNRPQRYTKCIVKESDLLYTAFLNERYQNIKKNTNSS